jgi:protein-L-isoaspartate(D-aspartate) O-methyltransferase
MTAPTRRSDRLRGGTHGAFRPSTEFHFAFRIIISSMSSYSALIEQLQKDGILRTRRIIDAFEAVPRENFLTEDTVFYAGDDTPLPIGHGQTNSQPTTVAFMLEFLRPLPGHKILDVGSGSAWTTGLLSFVVGKEGRVYGTEIIPELVQFGQNNLSKLDIKNATVSQSGEEFGMPSEALFDRILVSASAHELPQTLVDQLKPDGIMVLPIGNSIHRILKDIDDEITDEEYPGFVFVPLVV